MNEERSWLLVALALALLAGLARLPESGLQFLDSWCYARVAAEMAGSTDWVVPTWRGEPFLEKPPLLFWLTAALYRIFGVSEYAARALAGGATAGCVALLFWIGRRASGAPTGLLAVLLVCLTPMFLKWGRTYTTDPLFALLNLAALACGWLAAVNPAAWLLAGGLAALAVLTRGAAAAPLLLALLGLVFLGGRKGAGAGRERAWALAGAFLFLALALPWHLLALSEMGPAFLRTYIGAHTIERLQVNLIDSPRAYDPLYYPLHLLRTAWPALPLLALGLARLRRAWRPAIEPAGRLDRALLIFVAAQALMLAVVASRSPRYLLPLYPVLALLAARGLAHGLGAHGAQRLRRWSATGAAAAVLVVGVWPAPLGTPRGKPFRDLAAAVKRQEPEAHLQVQAALVDPWFERAFWFYLGRAPVAVSEADMGCAGPGPRARAGRGGAAASAAVVLQVERAERAEVCRPPGCRVLERTAGLVLTRRSCRAPSGAGGEGALTPSGDSL